MNDVNTGNEIPLSYAPTGQATVKQHVFNVPDLDASYLRSLAIPNEEGFVVRFQSGLCVKVKFEDYLRLHRIVTGVSTKTIWEYKRDGKCILHKATR